MTYDEAMARLMAVEPLPVGERLARWDWNNNPRSGWGSLHPRRCWRRLWDTGNDESGRYARTLRIARERAQAERRALVLIRHALTVMTAAETAWRTAANDLADENARLRATIRSRCSNDPADFEESYRAETFRLRAALEEALSLVGHFCFCQCRTCEEAKDRIRAIADGTVKP